MIVGPRGGCKDEVHVVIVNLQKSGLEGEDAGQRCDELLVRLNTSLGTNKYDNSLSK